MNVCGFTIDLPVSDGALIYMLVNLAVIVVGFVAVLWPRSKRE